MNKTPSVTIEIKCGKCGRFMAKFEGIRPTEHAPNLLYIQPCEECAVDRKFLSEVSKPVEEREGYGDKTKATTIDNYKA